MGGAGEDRPKGDALQHAPDPSLRGLTGPRKPFPAGRKAFRAGMCRRGKTGRILHSAAHHLGASVQDIGVDMVDLFWRELVMKREKTSSSAFFFALGEII